MQYRVRDHALGHAFRYQDRTGIRECLVRGRGRARRTTAIGGVLEGEIGAIRIYAITHRDAGRVNEALFKLVDVQQHIDGVELNINVELPQDGNRYVRLGRGLYVKSGTESTQVARRDAHVTGSTDFLTLLAELLVVLTIEFVSQNAKVGKDGKSTIRDHADRQELVGQGKSPALSRTQQL